MSLLEILLLSEDSRFTEFFDICRITLLSFGHVFHALLLAFRRVILPRFWLKMRLYLHDNAKRALYRDGDNSALYNDLTITRSLAPNHTA